jgi:hypothetical protein
MSLANAWEVTDEDIQQVMFKHGWEASSGKTAEAIEVVDREDVASAVLEETDFDKQVAAALSNIEDQLVTAGVLNLPKQFTAEDPNGPEFTVVVGNVGTVYTGKDVVRAKTEYLHYVGQSKEGLGRTGNQEVTLFNNGDPAEEYRPGEEE